LQAAIKDKYGIPADLKEGAGGVFFVYIDGAMVYNNQVTFRFPEHEEIFAEIDKVKT
jgi:predicted Rdx family selenoprotein